MLGRSYMCLHPYTHKFIRLLTNKQTREFFSPIQKFKSYMIYNCLFLWDEIFNNHIYYFYWLTLQHLLVLGYGILSGEIVWAILIKLHSIDIQRNKYSFVFCFPPIYSLELKLEFLLIIIFTMAEFPRSLG